MKTQYEIYLEAENERLAKENANVLAWSRLNNKLTDRVAALEAALQNCADECDHCNPIARAAISKTDEEIIKLEQ